MKTLKSIKLSAVFLFSVILVSCSQHKNSKTNTISSSASEKDYQSIKDEDISKITVFDAGNDNIDSYRIPSLVTAKDNSLLLFTEARKESSVDKSPTDIALKRSEDGGQTWSTIKIIADGKKGAFMDPTALVDKKTGKVFLFTTLWPKDDHSGKGNTAWVITSEDHGKTWSEPNEITEDIVVSGHYINGFGPGSGLQMKGKQFKNRLVLPTRQTDGKKLENRAIYSDNHGKTWKIGDPTGNGNEYMITEAPKDTLIYNLRAGKGKRVSGKSYDGGKNWTKGKIDFDLQSSADYGGVEASILGVDNTLFFVGTAGGLGSDKIEDRQNLMIYRSFNGGNTWQNKHLLYNKASGYSSTTQLEDGRLAIVFETADEDSFPKLRPDLRPADWMRLDVIILPKEITHPDYWF